MNGGVRRLLVHNAEHDRMHAGAISSARFEARALQESELARLLRDWLRERVELAGQPAPGARRGARRASRGRRLERARAYGAHPLRGEGLHRPGAQRCREGGGWSLNRSARPLEEDAAIVVSFDEAVGLPLGCEARPRRTTSGQLPDNFVVNFKTVPFQSHWWQALWAIAAHAATGQLLDNFPGHLGECQAGSSGSTDESDSTTSS